MDGMEVSSSREAKARETGMISKVGVIGAGQMGNGIAHVCALAGYRRRAERRQRRRASKRRSPPSTATWPARSRSGMITEERRERGARSASSSAPTLEDLGDCDLVIEAATEDEERQAQDLSASSARACKPERDARHQHLVDLDHPARRRRPTGPEHFIGMHFMNPVPLMQLVELIRGIATDDDDLRRPRATFVASLGKTVGRCRGFPRLHRQPHPAADDQRGGLHAL